MTAYLIVRAEVPEGDRKSFDHWYQVEHLPEAKAAFKANGAERGWSATDPSQHVAIYRFDDLKTAKSVTCSDALKELIVEFDRVWQGRVKRSRDVVEVAQSL